MNPRRIMILGASSVLGRATAELLARDGHDLWLTGRTPSKLPPLQAAFPQARITRLDLLSEASMQAFADELPEWNSLDGFVLASGLGELFPFASPRNHDDLWQVNLRSPITILRWLFPLLAAGREPSVVMISSVMGLVGAGGTAAYSASKTALLGLVRSLAIEWASRKIRVNAVAPGIVPSPLVSGMFASLTAEQVRRIETAHPLGFGRPEDVAHAIRFLLSPETRWITGITLPVDGGYTAH